MPKSKPIIPTSIKFYDDQRKFLKMTAKAQGHSSLSEVVKRLVNREMGVTK